MKKTKLVLTLALSTLLLSTGALSSLAADHDGKGTTTGKVDFTEQDDDSEGEVTKPDTPEEIIEIPGGNHTKGPLRLTIVPNFDFGTMEVASKTTWGQAKYLDFNKPEETTKTKISHFAQVEDIRGGQTEGWKLSVSATKFAGKDKDGATHTLDKSVIEFDEAKVFNTRINDLSNVLTVMDPAVNKIVPNDGTASLELMSTKENQSTNSSKTSLVFNNAYTNEEAVSEAQVKAGNPGVRLKSVGNDNKLKGVNYESTLTWSLVAAP